MVFTPTALLASPQAFRKVLFLVTLFVSAITSAQAQIYSPGDFRSSAHGTLATSGIWEQFNGSAWQATAAVPSAATNGTLYIQHTISSAGNAGLPNIAVQNNGVFVIANGFTISNKLQVLAGGAVQINNALAMAATANFDVAGTGKVVINHAYTTAATTLWAGTENFSPGSEFEFRNWGNQAVVANNTIISASMASNYTAMFGHVVFDLESTNPVTVLSAGVNKNLAHGNVHFRNGSAATAINLASAGSVTSGNGGNFVLESSFKGAANFSAATTSASATYTINGDFSVLGGLANLHSETANAVASHVYLKGNLTISAEGLLQNTNALAAAGANPAASLHFTGATTQQANIFPSLTNIPVRVASGATLQFARDLTIDGSAMFTIVQTGGTLDFNGHTYFGTSTFRQEAGATLRITSADGVSESGPSGNVQSSNRAFNSAGIYQYTGTAPQVTGTGLNPASGAKVIIIDNPATVTLTRTVNISNSSNAGVDIRKGVFEGAADAYVSMPVTNSVFLKMAENTVYRFLAPLANLGNNQLLPQANGAYTLHPGSTLEFAATGDQKMRGSTKVLGNVTFSGSGIKTLSGNAASIEGTVTITSGVIVDVENNTLGKTTTNFTMSGGRFRVSRTSGVQPAMAGQYNLTGGVVEFYGTTAGTTQSIRGAKEYFSVEITSAEANTEANNVSLATGSIDVKGEFSVKAPAVFQIGGGSAYITGTGEFLMEPGSTLKYGNSNGITMQACGTDASCGNIRTAIRNFPTNASYGFIGTATMASGNGLPAEVVNLYLHKNTAAQRVTLTQPVTVTGTADLATGTLEIANNRLTLAGTAAGNGTGTLRGSSASELEIAGSGELGTLYFTTGYQQVSKLILNRTNGCATLGTPLTILSAAEFNEGKLRTETNTELIFNANATYSGLAATSINATSYVTGPVIKTGAEAFRFPIGGEGTFAPATISAPANKGDVFSARYFSADPSLELGSATEPGVGKLSENGYWKIDHTGTSVVEIVLGSSNYPSASSDAESKQLVYFDAAAEPGLWRASAQAAGNTLANNLTESAQTLQYGYFTLATLTNPGSDTPLPVSLLYFKGQLAQGHAMLTWATAWEQDNSYFEIERSANGRDFELIGKVYSEGNTNNQKQYSFIDDVPLAGMAYYRLRQIDLDGKYVVFNTIALRFEGHAQIITKVYPNPATNIVNVSVELDSKEKAQVRIISATGIIMLETTINPEIERIFALPINNLLPGLYFVEVVTANSRSSKSFIKQ